MSLYSCPIGDCDLILRDKKHARSHYQREHSGEIETPAEYLNTFPDTEQRDFSGEEPTTEGHNPEYLTDNEPEGENTRLGTLYEFEREKYGSLEDYEGDSE